MFHRRVREVNQPISWSIVFTVILVGTAVVTITPQLGVVAPAAAAGIPAPCPINSTPGNCSAQFGVVGRAHWDELEAPKMLNCADCADEPSMGDNWKTETSVGGFWQSHLMFQAFDSTFRVICQDPASPADTPGFCSWTDASAGISSPSPKCNAVNMDPILLVNPIAGRTWEGGLSLTTAPAVSSFLCYSDDEGATWNGPVTPPGGQDHEGLGTGPWTAAGNSVPAPAGTPYAVYYCAQDLGNPTICSVSRDGGQSFGAAIAMNACPGIHGHPRVARTGNVYVPMKWCGGGTGYFYSKDQGQNWASGTVPGGPGNGRFDPSIGFSTCPPAPLACTNAPGQSTMYFGQAENTGAWIAVSPDEGGSWVPQGDDPAYSTLAPTCWRGAAKTYFNVACLISDTATIFANFADVMVGDDARAAYSFIAAQQTANTSDPEGCNSDLAWYYYVALTYNGGRTWNLEQASPDPVQFGGVWPNGATGTCGPNQQNRNMLDFQDLAFDARGRVYVGFAKGCGPAGAPASIPYYCNPALAAASTQKYTHRWSTILRQRTSCGLFQQFDDPATPPDCPVPPLIPGPAPLECAPLSQNISLGNPAALTATGGVTATYSWTTDPTASPSTGSGTTFAPVYPAAASYSATVTNGAETATCIVIVQYPQVPGNNPPTIGAIPTWTVAGDSISSTQDSGTTSGHSFRYQVLANDVDVGDTLTYSAPNLPPFCSLDPATGVLSCTMDHVGNWCNLYIVATDNHGASVGTAFCIRVSDMLRDADHDGVDDRLDNCPNLANGDQADADNDGMGDLCDPTPCPTDGSPCAIGGSNPSGGQAPISSAKQDQDHDQITNGVDNCPAIANNDQSDLDGDGVGDACDPDIDGDGISNANDNCPIAFNPGQADANQNGVGDACAVAAAAGLAGNTGHGSLGSAVGKSRDLTPVSALGQNAAYFAVGFALVAVGALIAFAAVKRGRTPKLPPPGSGR
jgi:hypothetical protein